MIPDHWVVDYLCIDLQQEGKFSMEAISTTTVSVTNTNCLSQQQCYHESTNIWFKITQQRKELS